MMKTSKLIKKLENAFRKGGLDGLMKLAKKKKIRKAVKKAVEKNKKEIYELE